MAPAVTTDTVPCARAPRLRAPVPTSPLNGDSADICETTVVATMSSSQTLGSPSDAKVSDGGCRDALATFHPFACVPSIVSGCPSATSLTNPATAGLTLSSAGSLVASTTAITEAVNGIGIRSVPPLGLQDARLVGFKNAQQHYAALNIVIKNNGTRNNMGIPNTMVGLADDAPLVRTLQGDALNGVGGTAAEASDNLSSSLSRTVSQLDGASSSEVPAVQVAASVHRMLITSRIASVVSSVSTCASTIDGSEDSYGSNELRPKNEADDPVPTADSNYISGCNNDEVVPVSSRLSVDGLCARQRSLVSRAELTLRRLRRLQSRQANSSVRQQISGLVAELRHRRCSDFASPIVTVLDAAKPTPDFKSMSTSELVGLVRRMQSSAEKNAVWLADQSRDGSRLNLSICPGIGETSGRLSSNLRHLESAIDSDATESSSGSESDEELETEPAESDQYVIVSETTDRATAKLSYVSERAMIACRWTWLQAQVSDLEYRIRQQSDIYRQLRSLKGAVSFRDQSPLPHDFCSTAANHSVTATTAASVFLSRKLPGEESAPAAETYLSSTESDETKSDISVAAVANESYLRAARCRPVRMCRRRRLLRLFGNAHLMSNRGRTAPTLPSTSAFLRCSGCYPPATACALCAGRTNGIGAAASGLRTSMVEKMALIDPAFHPVLSFPPDIQLTTRLADCIRQIPVAADSVPVSELMTTNNRGLTIRLSKANLKSSLSSASLKTIGHDGQQSNEGYPGCLGLGGDTMGDATVAYSSHSSTMKSFRSHLTARHARAVADKYRSNCLGLVKRLGRSASGRSGLKPGRPPRLSQSASSMSLKEGLRRQSSSSVFDINNVVIPYCATISRIEALAYKEILTPKWREAPKNEPVIGRRRSSAPPAKRSKRDAAANRIRSPSVTEEAMHAIVAASSTTTTVVAETCSDKAAKSYELQQSGFGGSAEADGDSVAMIEDLSDETFIARHLRYEIYEKKQCMPSAGHRKRSRSNRSESDHSLTFTTNPPRSPDTAEGLTDMATMMSSSPQFGCHPFVEPSPRPFEAVTFHLPPTSEQQASSTAVLVDGQASRRNSCAAVCASLSRTSSFVFADIAARCAVDVPPPSIDIPALQSWPLRNFPLTDSDYKLLLEGEEQQLGSAAAVAGMALHRHMVQPPAATTTAPSSVVSVTMRGSSSETSLSTVTDVGDVDDPEWTVIARQKVTDDNTPGFCLKIAKI